MRRGWKALVAVAAIAVLASMIFFVVPHNDGLAWAEKYKPREVRFRSLSIGREEVITEFHFDQLPPGFEREARGHIVKFDSDSGATFSGTTGNGYRIYFSREFKLLRVIQEPHWIAQYWSSLKAKLRLGP